MTDTTCQASISTTCRAWSLSLTQTPSINGTVGEARFAERMLAMLAARPAFSGDAKFWTIAVESDPLERSVVALLVKGKGRETVILTGHYDTVPIDDYGDLKPLAFEPEQLSAALIERLRRQASTSAEQRALTDLESGDFLPGRGLLDMKAGLAAGLAVAEAFALSPARRGNLLFLAVPDEEATSVGARQLARNLGHISAEHNLSPIAAINLDSIADDGDGSTGRTVTLGSIGKLLLTAYVAGRPAHACYPFAGVNAGALAGAIAAEVEWTPALADPAPGTPGMPPTLLSMKDSKSHYDVTTPAHVWTTWNALYFRQHPEAILAAFTAACRRATTDVMGRLTEKANALGALSGDAGLPDVEVLDFAQLLELAKRQSRNADAIVAEAATSAARSGGNLPEQCRLVTDALWQCAGLTKPVVVTGFGSLPYLPVSLGEGEAASRLARAVEAACAAVAVEMDVTVRQAAVFPGISDLSFLGEADLSTVPAIARCTPIWGHGIVWPAESAIANIPAINAGPWGRDYHTPLERLHVGYAFDVLPDFLARMVRTLLAR
jgi:arginine utilization protein RocB